MADSRWIYPLQRLDPGVGKQLQEADEKRIQEAVPRIRHIDCKTVSIVEFERTIIGSFDPKATYRIVYPDISEA